MERTEKGSVRERKCQCAATGKGAARNPRGSPTLPGSLLGPGWGLGPRTPPPPPRLAGLNAVRCVLGSAQGAWRARASGGPPWGWGCSSWVLPHAPSGSRTSWDLPGTISRVICRSCICRCRRAPLALCHPSTGDLGAPSFPGSVQGSAPSMRGVQLGPSEASARGEPVPPVSPFPLPSRHAEGFES